MNSCETIVRAHDHRGSLLLLFRFESDAMQLQQLGPYRLGKVLGKGGMGTVYEGVDTETGEPAAIKILSPSLAAEEGFRVRFEAEIESLKKLRHPNIVRLYGYGEQAGTLFYAMELVRRHQPGRRAAQRPPLRLARSDADRHQAVPSAQARTRSRRDSS